MELQSRQLAAGGPQDAPANPLDTFLANISLKMAASGVVSGAPALLKRS